MSDAIEYKIIRIDDDLTKLTAEVNLLLKDTKSKWILLGGVVMTSYVANWKITICYAQTLYRTL
jgi:hypothetical protein